MSGEGEGATAPYRDAVLRVFPELKNAHFSLLAPGWHSLALQADGRLVFKFPRNSEAERALVKEAGLLSFVRPAVSMRVPELSLHQGPQLFSRHEKIPGEHLLSADYAALSEPARDRLANDMARFYAQLHALDIGRMREAGAEASVWQSLDAIVARAVPLLPDELRDLALQAVEAWSALPPDPYGSIYGFFDGHGWNMAFDHQRERLNGLYDFADSGIGPLHQDFIYSNFISSDLTERIVVRYEGMTGRRLDRRRIALSTSIHRLSELAELADEPEHHAAMIRSIAEWAKGWA